MCCPSRQSYLCWENEWWTPDVSASPAPQWGGFTAGIHRQGCVCPCKAPRQRGRGRDAKHSRELLKGKQIKVVSSQSLQSGQSLLARTELMWVQPSSWQGFPSTEECQNGWSPCWQSCRGQDWEGSGTWANVNHLFPVHILNTLSCLDGCKIIHTIAFFSTVFFFFWEDNKHNPREELTLVLCFRGQAPGKTRLQSGIREKAPF